MTQNLRIALVQVDSETTNDLAEFERRMRRLVASYDAFTLWVFPELHLEPASAHADPATNARGLADESLERLGRLARELGIWLVPGSIYERAEDGRIHNTAIVFSPDGKRVAAYRKIFPWRPREATAPGDAFEVFDLPGYGRVGLSICYDIWFPEHTRHLAWMGADLILNLVQTATSDRAQELAIVRGNAIMNQVWIASLNAAAPAGRGRSVLVDPAGFVHAASPDASEEVLTGVIDIAAAARTRNEGTAGVSRPWHQFHSDDDPIPLPLYGGRIDPTTWTPNESSTR